MLRELLALHHQDQAQSTAIANGKAERFIRTLLAGWEYGAIYTSSAERNRSPDGWLWHYNHHRKHSALGHHPPITKVTNLLGTYT